jgi:hypothetical protein
MHLYVPIKILFFKGYCRLNLAVLLMRFLRRCGGAQVKATKKVSSCGSTGHSRCGEAHKPVFGSGGSTGHSRCGEAHKPVVSFCCGSTGHSRCGEAHKPGWFCRMRDKSLRRSNPVSLQVIVVSLSPSWRRLLILFRNQEFYPCVCVCF